jgi:photosynthetic reaction center cytochrome c subunit
VTFTIKLTGVIVTVLLIGGTVLAFKKTQAYQHGYPGTAMDLVQSDDELAKKLKANTVPAALPAVPQDGPLSVDTYQNVQVLGHLSVAEFGRTMAAMTTWVSPQQGCAYCHNVANMASDEVYAKVVARRMLQMTMHINQDWQQHVKGTGVTCYTCHRGNPVPANIWFNGPASDPTARPMMQGKGYQNTAATDVGLASLPSNVFETYLSGNTSIRVQGNAPLPSEANNRHSIKQTEWTYGLMMHMSNSLGVNCTYCHNTRSMGEWETSPPQRTTAWYGIRMVRDLNNQYLTPLTDVFPAYRKGPHGDAPKLNCATCHNNAYKPLLGVSMLKDYTVLAEAKPQPAKTPPPPPEGSAPTEGAAPAPGDAPAPAPAQ